MRRRRTGCVAAATYILIAGLLASGCVNHATNSAQFCSRNAKLLDVSQDNIVLTKDQAAYYDDNLQKSMRYSEDGSRKVRTSARNLADAYADIRKIAGDDKVKDTEVKQKYAKLLERRTQMRAVCAQVAQA